MGKFEGLSDPSRHTTSLLVQGSVGSPSSGVSATPCLHHHEPKLDVTYSYRLV